MHGACHRQRDESEQVDWAAGQRSSPGGDARRVRNAISGGLVSTNPRSVVALGHLAPRPWFRRPPISMPSCGHYADRVLGASRPGAPRQTNRGRPPPAATAHSDRKPGPHPAVTLSATAEAVQDYSKAAASRLEFGARRLMNWFCKFDTVGVVFSVCARI